MRGTRPGSAVRTLQFLEQPGSGVGPQEVGGTGRNAQGPGCLVARQTGEKAQLDELGRSRIGSRQLVQELINFEKVIARLLAKGGGLVQVDADPLAAALDAALAAGLLDQNTAHRLSGRCKEMPPAVPVLCLLDIHQTQ